jgi:hypothetical protein
VGVLPSASVTLDDIRCCLVIPSTEAKAAVILGPVKPGAPLLSPMEITVDAGNQCASGNLSLQPKGKRGAGFP